jgi:very-short-patch-repair endonuclease
MKYDEIKELAQQLRSNQTAEEKVLWQKLRKRMIGGCRFLRQHPIIYEARNKEYFFYIPDFYCAAKKVVIELDGKIHDFQHSRDNHREEILKAHHLKILRIKNNELENLDLVIRKIEDFLKSIP